MAGQWLVIMSEIGFNSKSQQKMMITDLAPEFVLPLYLNHLSL